MYQFINVFLPSFHLLGIILCDFMTEDVYPDPNCCGSSSLRVRKESQRPVFLPVYLNNEPLWRGMSRYQYFMEHPLGNLALAIKLTIFNSETSWGFLCAISSRLCSKWGLIDYKQYQIGYSKPNCIQEKVVEKLDPTGDINQHLVPRGKLMTSLTSQLSEPTSEVKPTAISTACCPIRTQTLGGVIQEVSGFWKDIMMPWKTLCHASQGAVFQADPSIRTDVFTYQST